jgi:drug/metabolite transporter superfamily protein YnfA
MDILNTCANFRENDSILFLMVGIIAISLSGIIKTLEAQCLSVISAYK